MSSTELPWTKPPTLPTQPKSWSMSRPVGCLISALMSGTCGGRAADVAELLVELLDALAEAELEALDELVVAVGDRLADVGRAEGEPGARTAASRRCRSPRVVMSPAGPVAWKENESVVGAAGEHDRLVAELRRSDRWRRLVELLLRDRAAGDRRVDGGLRVDVGVEDGVVGDGVERVGGGRVVGERVALAGVDRVLDALLGAEHEEVVDDRVGAWPSESTW